VFLRAGNRLSVAIGKLPLPLNHQREVNLGVELSNTLYMPVHGPKVQSDPRGDLRVRASTTTAHQGCGYPELAFWERRQQHGQVMRNRTF
jgi:hypothetical protein